MSNAQNSNPARPPIPIQTERQLRVLLDSLDAALAVEGDVAECGVAAGGTAYCMLERMRANGSTKTVHLFDTYCGHPDITKSWELPFLDRALSHWGGLAGDNAHSVSDQYVSMAQTFQLANERVPPGGYLVVHDWSFPGTRRAASEFISEKDWACVGRDKERQKAFRRKSV